MELHHLTESGYFLRFCVALLLGVAIGIEREWRNKMANLHTTAMVAAGAAIFSMISPLLLAKGADPTRIAAQVVSGVGFLAGGVILRQGTSVRGLTTAATLWATSAVGVLVGFGFLWEATGASIAIIGANVLLYPLSAFLGSKRRDTEDVVATYTVEVAAAASAEAPVRGRILDVVSSTTLTLMSIETHRANSQTMLIQAQMSRSGKDDRQIENLTASIRDIPGVMETQWHVTTRFIE